MRVLYALVGEPGVGKSTLVKKYNLEDSVVSTDQLRQIFAGKDYTWNAESEMVQVGVSQSANKDVFDTLDKVLELKAKQGRTIVVDSTHLYKGAFARYKKLKEDYGYRIIAIDMRARNLGMSFDDLKKQNNNPDRVAEGKNVSDSTLQKFWDRASNFKAPTYVNVIGTDQVWDSLHWKMDRDSDNYKHIKVIGDIHGCYDVLHEALGELQDDTEYIFVGDYLDRGPQNVQTFKFFQSILKNKNVVLLRGNHELHWDKFINGYPVTARETAKITIPQLERAGIGKKEINQFRRHLQDLYMFTFGGGNFLATHAGIPTQLISDLYKKENNNFAMFEIMGMPEDIFTKGVGAFKADVDKDYAENAYADMPIQVHGHRNEFPAVESDMIYNLEQKVERGHYLSVLDLSKDANGKAVVKQLNYENKNFRADQAEDDLELDLSNLTNEDIMGVMDASKNINNRSVEDNIVAHNFNTHAFLNDNFNNFTMTARGLFTDNHGKVIGRGFNKFFNYLQCEETQHNEIVKHTYSAIATKKYDGFLTLVFVVDGKLKVFSKGGAPAYSAVAREDLINYVAKYKTEDNDRHFAEYLIVDWINNIAEGYTIVLETIDTKDSHIVKYADTKQIVLAAVKNQYIFEENDDIADMFAKAFLLQRPEKRFIADEDGLELLIDNQTGKHAFKDNVEQEGWVVRFNDGFRFKLKNNWYLKTKELRNKLTQVKEYPEVIRERAYTRSLEHAIDEANTDKIAHYDDVDATLKNFLFNLSDEQLSNLETRPDQIFDHKENSGEVDVAKVKKCYPKLFSGEFNENTN